MRFRPYSRPPQPSEVVEDLFGVADLLTQVERNLQRIYRAAGAEHTAAFDAAVPEFDFAAAAERLKAYGAKWQAAIEDAASPTEKM